jgi:hypothetical protein
MASRVVRVTLRRSSIDAEPDLRPGVRSLGAKCQLAKFRPMRDCRARHLRRLRDGPQRRDLRAAIESLDRRRRFALLLFSVTNKRVPGGVVHKLPVDLREALIANSTALAAWRDITPLARNEFICWVEDAKRAFSAMMSMKKFDVATIEAARRG